MVALCASAVPGFALGDGGPAARLFDPSTVVTAQFPMVEPPAPVAGPPRAAPTATKNIVLNIDLKVDDRQAPPTESTPTPAPQAAAPSSPFDFSAAGSAPAALSVPSEGGPEAQAPDPAPAPVQAPAPEPLVAVADPTPAPAAKEELTPAAPSPSLADKPIRFGDGIVLGMAEPADASCFDRDGAGRVCIIPVAWPADLEPFFKVNSALYRGSKSIARIDADGRIDVVFGLFPAENFDRIAGQFVLEFGGAEKTEVPMALIGAPKARNRVLRWTRLDENGKPVILELRGNDDLRDILPDEVHGVVRLYREGAQPLFHDLQTTDFLLHAMRAGAT